MSCDLEHLEQIFKTQNPAAFLSVSALGLVPDINKILDLCERYGVLFLEDNCESMGSKYFNRYLGTFGLASVFSMYFGHHLSTIEGGFINTNDKDLYHALLMMRSHGWDRDLPEETQKEIRERYNVSDFEALYNFYVCGLNVRSTDLQAFLGIRAIDKLDEYTELRSENFNMYHHYMLLQNELRIKPRYFYTTSNFAYPVVHQRRDELIADLQKNNVEVRPLIAGNIANKPFWYQKYGRSSDLPNCDVVDKYGFYLPNHQDMTEKDIMFICGILNEYS